MIPEIISALSIREYTERPLPCVYFLCLKGELQYVGQTLCLGSRVRGHLGSRGRALKEFDRVYFMPVPRASLNCTESAFIKAFRPRLNSIPPRPLTQSEKAVLLRHGFEVDEFGNYRKTVNTGGVNA